MLNAGAGQFEPFFMSRTRGKGSSAAAGTAFSARLLPKEPEERLEEQLEEQLEEEGDRQTDVNRVFHGELFIKHTVHGVETSSTPQMIT